MSRLERANARRCGVLAALGLLALSCSPAPTSAPPPQAPTPASTPPPRPPEAHPTFSVKVSGAGRRVVFLPDLQAPGDVWAETVAHLGPGFEAHVIDIAGFAGNAPAGLLTPKLHEELGRYLRERARGAVLVGHMYGAYQAWWLAMTEADAVGGVVAIDAPPSAGGGEPEEIAEIEEGRRKLAGADAESFRKMTTRRVTSMVADAERGRALAEAATHSSQEVVADAFYDMMTRDLRAQIGAIKAPVLAVMSTAHQPPEVLPARKEHYRRQLAPIARHELLVLDGSKHYVMFDARERFYAALDRFLQESAAPTPAARR